LSLFDAVTPTNTAMLASNAAA
jgi:hypothetical protein